MFIFENFSDDSCMCKDNNEDRQDTTDTMIDIDPVVPWIDLQNWFRYQWHEIFQERSLP